ncbi:MAG TPA: tRNA (guanosine(37)-N1)-methyltransferase TrmD [Terracidiphilus sp.]|nr:tRNA (guanosine(37)-N1)-methyltransferase TrmD [Terracidiphilus sp.]
MRFDIVTIFPAFFSGFFEHGIVRRAQAEGLVTIGVHDLREFTHDRHRSVDDRPFGGGEGMVLKPEPLAEALESLGIRPKGVPQGLKPPPQEAAVGGTAEAMPFQGFQSRAQEGGARVILLSAQGRPFTQAVARDLAAMDRIVLICGRYEGVDERINQLYCDLELSIGDYVLSGGELAAAVVLDTVMRLIPGVLGNEASGEFESFGAPDAAIDTDVEGVPRSQHGSGGLLDYPHYTRPAEFRGLKAPEVLLNGDHRQIRKWRREQQLRKTLQNRPDLLAQAELTPADRRMIAGWAEKRET